MTSITSLFVSSAYAQTPATVTKKTAAQIFESGQAQYQAGNFSRACQIWKDLDPVALPRTGLYADYTLMAYDAALKAGCTGEELGLFRDRALSNPPQASQSLSALADLFFLDLQARYGQGSAGLKKQIIGPVMIAKEPRYAPAYPGVSKYDNAAFYLVLADLIYQHYPDNANLALDSITYSQTHWSSDPNYPGDYAAALLREH